LAAPTFSLNLNLMSKLTSLLVQIPLRLKDLTGAKPVLAPTTGEFVKGINLGGEAVTLAGQRWESYSSALANGLTVPQAQSAATQITPQPYADPALRSLLNTVIYRPETLEISQSLANGSYEIYLWLMENYQTHWHRLELQINGQPVAQDLCYLPFGTWQRYGPYSATVSDAALQLSLSTGNSEVDAHLMGLSIFRVGP
jgi:hypothetical protein